MAKTRIKSTSRRELAACIEGDCTNAINAHGPDFIIIGSCSGSKTSPSITPSNEVVVEGISGIAATPTANNPPTVGQEVAMAAGAAGDGSQKRRRMYMITADVPLSTASAANGTSTANGTNTAVGAASAATAAVPASNGGPRKRKLYIIMEEKANDAKMPKVTANGSGDPPYLQLKSTIDRILPQLLNRINTMEQQQNAQTGGSCGVNGTNGGGGGNIAAVITAPRAQSSSIEPSPDKAQAQAKSTKHSSGGYPTAGSMTVIANGAKSSVINGVRYPHEGVIISAQRPMTVTLPPKKNRIKMCSLDELAAVAANAIPQATTPTARETTFIRHCETANGQQQIAAQSITPRRSSPLMGGVISARAKRSPASDVSVCGGGGGAGGGNGGGVAFEDPSRILSTHVPVIACAHGQNGGAPGMAVKRFASLGGLYKPPVDTAASPLAPSPSLSPSPSPSTSTSSFPNTNTDSSSDLRVVVGVPVICGSSNGGGGGGDIGDDDSSAPGSILASIDDNSIPSPEMTHQIALSNGAILASNELLTPDITLIGDCEFINEVFVLLTRMEEPKKSLMKSYIRRLLTENSPGNGSETNNAAAAATKTTNIG